MRNPIDKTSGCQLFIGNMAIYAMRNTAWQNVRMPIVDEKAPSELSFDSMVNELKDISPDTACVFNCQVMVMMMMMMVNGEWAEKIFSCHSLRLQLSGGSRLGMANYMASSLAWKLGMQLNSSPSLFCLHWILSLVFLLPSLNCHVQCFAANIPSFCRTTLESFISNLSNCFLFMFWIILSILMSFLNLKFYISDGKRANNDRNDCCHTDGRYCTGTKTKI